MGIDIRLINILKTLHSDTKYSVRTNNGNSDEFELKRGVREGCRSSTASINIHHTVSLLMSGGRD